MEGGFLENLACPRCLGLLTLEGTREPPEGGCILQCSSEALRFPVRDGVPLLVRPEREVELDAFAAAYSRVWQREGWGSSDSDYLLGLPWRDTTGRQRDKWRVKARSLEALLRFLEGVEAEVVADLGAGTGWLSYHLARRGYRVYAMDVLLDELLGLGAAGTYLHHGPFFQRLRGELERPPLREGAVDVAICNASLHYVLDLKEALRGIRRILRDTGGLVVMNSPVHRDPSSAVWAQEDFRARLQTQGAPEQVYVRYHHFVWENLVRDLAELVGPVQEVRFNPGVGFQLNRRVKGLILGLELASFPILAVRRSV